MDFVGAMIHGPTDGRFPTAARYGELNDATHIAAMDAVCSFRMFDACLRKECDDA
jgi:hypothetical protein